MIYNAPSYFYRDLRRELTTAISAYQVASTALDNALNPIRIASTSISLSITNALWIVPEVEGWCLRPYTMIEEVCRDNLDHSTRRRMFKRRKGGEFAKWNEVCDLYRQGSRGSYSYFKWPRKRDEDGCTTTWLGITQGCRMPESMRAGKNLTLYEEGCLADESCASDRFGMSSRLTQIASMPASIENVIYDEDRSIAALWAAIDSLAEEAAELLGEVRKHLLAFWNILRRPSTKAPLPYVRLPARPVGRGDPRHSSGRKHRRVVQAPVRVVQQGRSRDGFCGGWDALCEEKDHKRERGATCC